MTENGYKCLVLEKRNHVGGNCYTRKEDGINKTCPHCNVNLSVPKDSQYIICGYINDEYDWLGCGHDWCGKCNKMLCKSWDKDNLNMIENRNHNNSCCKKYAKENNINIDLFCNCVN